MRKICGKGVEKSLNCFFFFFNKKENDGKKSLKKTAEKIEGKNLDKNVEK